MIGSWLPSMRFEKWTVPTRADARSWSATAGSTRAPWMSGGVGWWPPANGRARGGLAAALQRLGGHSRNIHGNQTPKHPAGQKQVDVLRAVGAHREGRTPSSAPERQSPGFDYPGDVS